MQLTLLTALALAAPLLSAPIIDPQIIIHNGCKFPVWITSVSSTTGPTSRVAPSTYWTQAEFFDKSGTALKITRGESDLWNAQPVLQLGYTYAANTSIYYDLSTAYGYNFWGEDVSVRGDEDKNVDAIEWKGQPGPSRTYSYFGSTGLRVELCEESKDEQ